MTSGTLYRKSRLTYTTVSFSVYWAPGPSVLRFEARQEFQATLWPRNGVIDMLIIAQFSALGAIYWVILFLSCFVRWVAPGDGTLTVLESDASTEHISTQGVA